MTTWYPNTVSPTSGTFVRRDSQLLAQRHDVRVLHLISPHLVAPGEQTSSVDGDVQVTRVPMSTTGIRSIRDAWKHIDAAMKDVDVLHTHAFSTLLPFASRPVELPWVHSEHWSGIADPASLTPRGRAVRNLTAPLLRRPDVVTAVSGYLADRIRPYRRGPIVVVPSVVAPSPVVPPPRDPGEIRLVSVGGLVPGKDPLLAREIVRDLHGRGQRATLTWVGEGPLRGEIEATASLGDGFTLLGTQDASGVGQALDNAHIFLLPTRGETLCLSALEAITHGRPVVIGARGGQADYVVAGNGRLVEGRTPGAYADAIREVWAARDSYDPAEVAATLGERFRPEAVLAGYEGAYRLAAESR